MQKKIKELMMTGTMLLAACTMSFQNVMPVWAAYDVETSENTEDTISTSQISDTSEQTEPAETTENTDTSESTENAENADSSEETTQTAVWPEKPEITGENAILMDAATGIVLYNKNMESTQYPAGAAKLMTALLILENAQLTDSVTFTETGVALCTEGATNISTQVGETLTVEQCLYAILLASANDVTTQMAEQIGGSVDGFVAMMNERAAALGCTCTKFTNPTGLPDENQSTSARDIALICQAAFANEEYSRIASASSYVIPATNMTATERTLTNQLSLAVEGENYYDGILGGKGGFTDASGAIVACAVQRDDRQLIAVILKDTEEEVSKDAVSMLDYGYNSFDNIDLSNGMEVVDGGTGVVPSGVTVDQLELIPVEEDGNMTILYYYGDNSVGSATVTIASWNAYQNPESAAIEQSQAEKEAAEQAEIEAKAQAEAQAEAEAKAAQEKIENRQRQLLYVMGGLVAFALFLTFVMFIRLLVKRHKKKKRRNKNRKKKR